MAGTLNDKLGEITSSLPYFLPEAALTAGMLIILLAGFFPAIVNEKIMRVLALLLLAILLVLDTRQWLMLGDDLHYLFQNMISLDRGAVFWKFLFEGGAAVAIFMGFTNRNAPEKHSEYYMLILAVVLGAHLLAMATNLLMIFIGIEIISISSYILTTFSFDRSGAEAGVKYLLFGAVASGVMIYGMSWLYALTGSLHYTDPDFARILMDVDIIPLVIAGSFVLGGLLFKISAAPMHIWAPDVYTSAPTPVVAFFSIVPKLAGFAILVRWTLVINLSGLGPVNWSSILAVIAMVTITIGNFSALWQKNVKRMLAYSAIAHSGFLLVGIVAFSQIAMYALMFYAAVYLIMNMAAFLLVNYIQRRHGYLTIEEYAGFHKNSSFLAILMVVIMVSLAGLPPTGGFTAKLLIFSALWDSYSLSGNAWMLYLLVFGLVNTVVSLFYYLKIPYFMIFKTGGTEMKKSENIYSIENFLGLIMVLALLIIFFDPQVLMRIINSVSFAF